MKNQKNLILPETIIIDIMAMTAQLGDVALDYHKKIGNTNTKEIIRVYHRIIEKLMNLDEYDEDEQRVSLEDRRRVEHKFKHKGDKHEWDYRFHNESIFWRKEKRRSQKVR